MYRDCRGSSLDSINGFVYAGTGKYAMNFKRISIENISESCDTGCKTSNTTSGKGTEKHIYKDTIDFTQSPYDSIRKNKLCEVYFSVYVKGWNGAFTTIQNPNVYLDAMLNICHPDANIHSPEFNNKPIFNVCCNQVFRYNPGILKHNDIDSFSFELASVLNDYNKKATYTNDFIPTIPMSPFCPPRPAVVNCRPSPNRNPPRGFYFNPLISDIVFTPNVCDEVGAIKFQVKQWRFNSKTKKMDLIGYVNRQILLIVHQCPDNNPPNFSSGANNYNICIGDSLKLNFATKDDPFLPNQKKSDTTIVSWSNNLENASFSYLDSKAREKTAVLKWKAKGNPYQITQKYIYLKVIDKHCNTQESKGVLINVFPKINAVKNTDIKDIKGCNYISLSNKLKVDSVTNKSQLEYFYWVTRISPDIQQLYISFKQNDKFFYHTSGRYVITSRIKFKGSSCEIFHYDTLDIEVINPFNSSLNNSLVCKGDTILLGNSNFYDSSTTISWEYPIGNIVSNSNTYQFIQNGNSNLFRLRRQNSHCKDSFDFEIFTTNNFSLNSRDTFICLNNNFNLTLKNFSPKKPYKTLWIINGKDSTFKDLYGNIKITNPASIKVQYIKNPKCIEEKSIMINTSALPAINFNYTDSNICQNNLITIKPIYKKHLFPIKKYNWKFNNIVLNSNDSQIINKFNQNQSIELFITDSLNCISNTSIIKLNILPKPNFNLIDSANCKTLNPYLAIVSNDIIDKTKIEWWIDNKLDTNKRLKYFSAFPKSLTVMVKIYDTLTCLNEKTIQTLAITRPKFLFPNTKFCRNQVVTLYPTYSSVKPIVYYNWFENGENMFYPISRYSFRMKDSIVLRHIIKDEKGCIYQDSIKIKPSIPVLNIKGDTIYNLNSIVKLEAVQTFSSYLWSNGTTLKTNYYSAKKYITPGVYPVQLIASFNPNCRDTANVNLTILPSTNLQTPKSVSFQIYPNPSNGIFTINTKIGGVVEVFYISGQLLLTHAVQEGENTLNLQLWSKGIYFLKFEEKVYKLVIG